MAKPNMPDSDTTLLVADPAGDVDNSHTDSQSADEDAGSSSSSSNSRSRQLRAAGLPVAGGLLLLTGLLCAKEWPSRSHVAAGNANLQLFKDEPCNDGVEAGKVGLRGQNPCRIDTKLDEQVSDAGEKCSWTRENCHETRCCKDAGMQCYEQGAAWAECKPSCAHAPDPVHWDGKNWSCKALGPRAPGKAPVCAQPGADCSESKCCAVPGTQCYEKTPGGWATCKVNCTAGIDLTDSNADPWTCNTLGPRAPKAAPWVASQCSASGQDCRETKCCGAPGEQCYVRDEFWASCKSNCTPGVDPSEPWNQRKWSCDTIGVRTPPSPAAPAEGSVKLASWVPDVCAAQGGNCRSAKCCRDAGMQCFEKDGQMAGCKAECSPGPDLSDVDSKPWSCKALGPRTPGSPKPSPPPNVSSWVASECAKSSEGCLESKCCADVGMQCFAKNDGWAACLNECTPGENRSAFGDVDAKPWSCKALGMRTPRPWGHPSLFCFAVMRTVGYEGDLMRYQMSKSAGIFACDQFEVFSNTPYTGRGTTWWHPADEDVVEVPLVSMYLGVGPLGPVNTIPFKPTYVGTSMDHTAGNTELFLRVWAKVKETGKHATTDWTVKVDPDAVLLPSRLRATLQPYNGLSTYIVNCNKPGMAPMMFGSVEMFSRQAMQTFFERKQECLDGLGWKMWGEDYFMGKCLDMLGVKRTNQFDVVSDGVCKGVDCSNPAAAAFHPKKDSASWMACLAQAEAR